VTRLQAVQQAVTTAAACVAHQPAGRGDALPERLVVAVGSSNPVHVRATEAAIADLLGKEVANRVTIVANPMAAPEGVPEHTIGALAFDGAAKRLASLQAAWSASTREGADDVPSVLVAIQDGLVKSGGAWHSVAVVAAADRDGCQEVVTSLGVQAGVECSDPEKCVRRRCVCIPPFHCGLLTAVRVTQAASGSCRGLVV